MELIKKLKNSKMFGKAKKLLPYLGIPLVFATGLVKAQNMGEFKKDSVKEHTILIKDNYYEPIKWDIITSQDLEKKVRTRKKHWEISKKPVDNVRFSLANNLSLSWGLSFPILDYYGKRNKNRLTTNLDAMIGTPGILSEKTEFSSSESKEIDKVKYYLPKGAIQEQWQYPILELGLSMTLNSDYVKEGGLTIGGGIQFVSSKVKIESETTKDFDLPENHVYSVSPILNQEFAILPYIRLDADINNTSLGIFFDFNIGDFSKMARSTGDFGVKYRFSQLK